MTGSRVQLVNGIALIASFAASRLVWGTYQTVNMYRDVWRALQTPGELPVPPWLALAYLVAITILSGLNFWWFSRMIVTLGKRFEKPRGEVNEKAWADKSLRSEDFTLSCAGSMSDGDYTRYRSRSTAVSPERDHHRTGDA